MTTQLAALKQEVNNLAEVFSEVEQDLEPNVYKMFSGPLEKVGGLMQQCSDQMESMSAVMRLLALLGKRPDIKLSLRNIEVWEAQFADGRRPIRPDLRLEPLEAPPEGDDHTEEDDFTEVGEEVPAATIRGIYDPWTTMPIRPVETTVRQPREVVAVPATRVMTFNEAMERMQAERAGVRGTPAVDEGF